MRLIYTMKLLLKFLVGGSASSTSGRRAAPRAVLLVVPHNAGSNREIGEHTAESSSDTAEREKTRRVGVYIDVCNSMIIHCCTLSMHGGNTHTPTLRVYTLRYQRMIAILNFKFFQTL